MLRGFVTESEDGLAVTEIGALTCRLMIDVESAAGLLTALAEAPVPTTADEAEEARSSDTRHWRRVPFATGR